MHVKNYLKKRGINFKEFKHKAVFTVAESKKEKIHDLIKGKHCKTLFLKDKNYSKYFLVVIEGDKRLNLKSLEKLLDSKLTFCNETELKEIIEVYPGAVSPFGLINDKNSIVKLIIDKSVLNEEYVNFHPNINTETLELPIEDFKKYLSTLENEILIEEL